MVFKRNTAGLIYTIIGILLPFFNSVCLASSVGNTYFSYNYNDVSESSIYFQRDQAPLSDISIKRDTDFINRIKNYRLFYRTNSFLNQGEMIGFPPAKSFYSPLFVAPRPAYYNYLFMFKPFE
jgi:hypothetical protein